MHHSKKADVVTVLSGRKIKRLFDGFLQRTTCRRNAAVKEEGWVNVVEWNFRKLLQ